MNTGTTDSGGGPADPQASGGNDGPQALRTPGTGGDSAAPQAAVIIPHYNDVARLARCLAALMCQDTAGTEIVVVDNGSTEALDTVRADHPAVRFVTEPQKGAAAARNRGVLETTAPHLFFLDADCVPAPDWLAVAQRAVMRADLVGGRIGVFDETPAPRNGPQAFETVFAFDYRRYIEVKGFSVTANLLTHRNVFLAVGPFVPGLSEDMDWCRRATARGYRLICAEDLAVGHPTRSSWPELRRKWHRTTREMFALNGTGPAARLKWALRAVAMPLSALPHLPRVLTSPRLQGSGERARAAATLVRLRAQRGLWMLQQAAGRAI